MVFTFNAFKKIFELNFPEASQLEMSQLYRETYSACGGNISPEGFFAVASDLNFFIKYIRINTNLKSPVLESSSGGSDKVEKFAEGINFNVPYMEYDNIIKGFLPRIE